MCVGGGAGVRGKKAREANLEARRAPMFSQLGVWRAENGWSGHPWCWPEGSLPPVTLLYVRPLVLFPLPKSTHGSLHLQSWSRVAPPPSVTHRLPRALIDTPRRGVSASSSLPSGCSALHQGRYLDGVVEKRLRARHR